MSVRKVTYLVIGPPISPWNVGLTMMNLGFSNKRDGKDKQHEIQLFIHH